MKKIQSSNTIILVFDSKAHKKNIKFLMEKIYKTKVIKINTLITPKGLKKAFIKLSPDQDALDVANKIGFI
jgi:large subunit ribosomal protein L23Ae